MSSSKDAPSSAANIEKLVTLTREKEFIQNLQARHQQLEKLHLEVKQHCANPEINPDLRKPDFKLPEHEAQWLEEVDCQLDQLGEQLEAQGPALQELYDRSQAEFRARMKEHAERLQAHADWLHTHADRCEEYEKLFEQQEKDERKAKRLGWFLDEFEGVVKRRDGKGKGKGEEEGEGESQSATETGDEETDAEGGGKAITGEEE